ncbi:MAG: GNAT family N-acetyltransferase [Acidobacteriaceae bacterium]
MPNNTLPLTIRALSPADAAAVANLSAQLGYPAPHDTIRQRIEDLSTSPDHALFAACLGADPVGWIEVSISRHLQSAPCALIGGLVVSQEVRSRGIGKRLCLAAENWARNQGLALLRVRSQIAREQAHKFYLREGFRQTKVSAVFEKALL